MSQPSIPCSEFDDQEAQYRAFCRQDGMRRYNRAWECFIQKARSMIINQIRQRIRNVVATESDEVAEDIFHEQLGRFSERIAAGRFSDPATRQVKFTTILYQMCSMAAIDRYRQETFRTTNTMDWTGADWNPTLTDPQASVEEALMDDETSRHYQKILRQAVEQLPQQQRIAIELSYFQELSDKEVAERMQSDIRNVYNLKYKAIKQLRQSGALNMLSSDGI
ncbi:RNA polymerase sigma factor [Fibrisoma limi]|nr:sigma-70 family RNA polymerase sigma factor [Fibrisoma limi]